MRRVVFAALAALGLMGAAPAGWRAPDPENLLLVDTTKGRIVVEMRPELAPQSVARVKLLAREGVYDGLLFHRVIDGFVAQTGNPNNRDGGTSRHPDLPPEFQFRIPEERASLLVARSDGREGLVGSTPIAAVSAAEQARSPDQRLRGWGAYCAGVVGMGRQADPATANSEIFFMREPARRLDHEYAVWGRVIVGLEAVRALAVGEPPATPDRMLRVRVAADLPPAERPQLLVEDERSAAFQARAEALKADRGAAFTICDLEVRVRRG